ncbi:MAG: ATP-binding cassette domain-containing protein [Polyangiaceae bacterium]
MTAPLVLCENVKKSFHHMGRTLEVLRGIDLEIGAGEMVGVVGQSGAGKSTFLHCVGTLDVPTSGSIKIDGAEITGLVVAPRRRSATGRWASSSSSITSSPSSTRSRTW